MLRARDAHRRRSGQFDWRRPPGPRCAAPSEAALPVLYASPPRRCPRPSGRGSRGCPRSRQPTGSTIAAAAGCRCAFSRNAIAGTCTAREISRNRLAGSLCAAPAPATSASPPPPPRGGARRHAVRQRRYRERQKRAVTDQGFPLVTRRCSVLRHLLSASESIDVDSKEPSRTPTRLLQTHCAFCGRSLPPLPGFTPGAGADESRRTRHLRVRR